MRINEVERLVGITKKNIRFYEKENLLHPGRSLENGYRDYDAADVEELKRIRLFRRLAVPLEEIRSMQTGTLSAQSVLRRHIIALEEQSANLLNVRAVCEKLLENGEPYARLDADAWLSKLEQMEKEGMRFMDVKNLDRKRKKRGSVTAAAVFCALMAASEGIFCWACLKEPGMPAVLFVVFTAIPAVFIVGTLLALYQRMKEIDGGEEDAAAKY